MNKEEIEELKDFTIDLTDIDELALGLEVCSKKSNMVIQEFADTIIQLQQENRELKKENKILRENAENNDKVVDKVNWENQLLKKQLEEYKDKINRYENFEINKTIDKLRLKHNTQQKEFIKYLEDNWKQTQDIWYIKILQKYKEIVKSQSSLKQKCHNESLWFELDELLDKMQEIGGSDNNE